MGAGRDQRLVGVIGPGAFSRFLTHESGFQVAVDGDHLTWSYEGTELKFIVLNERRELYGG